MPAIVDRVVSDAADIRAIWEERGVIVWPEFLDRGGAGRLLRLCDDVLERVFAEDPRLRGASNIAYLTEPRFFGGGVGRLIELLEIIAEPRILMLLERLGGAPPLFHNTQYFFDPDRSWDGDWHRDTQFLASDPELERIRMAAATGVHFRVALLPDERLELVPGSHGRWDSPDELAIRKGAGPASGSMPGSERVSLETGDACLFHAWSIHRGTYRRGEPRRTLDLIYQWGARSDYSPPPATCFADRRILAYLSPSARRFFERFIEAYREFWPVGGESKSGRSPRALA